MLKGAAKAIKAYLRPGRPVEARLGLELVPERFALAYRRIRCETFAAFAGARPGRG
jgi:hypothetical protein